MAGLRPRAMSAPEFHALVDASVELKTADIAAIVKPMQIEVHAASVSVLSMRNEVHCLVQVGKYFFLTQPRHRSSYAEGGQILECFCQRRFCAQVERFH